MKKFLAFGLFLAGLVGLATAAPLPIQTPAKQTKFVRVQDKDGTPSALQTAIVTYAKGDTTVDLVGAIHVGDRAYYKNLNTRFNNYDAVLYELVAAQNTRPAKGQSNTVGMLAKIYLDLDGQLERINYGKANFVHADLSIDEIKTEMRKRGDDGMILVLRVIADVLQKKNLGEPQQKALPFLFASGPIGLKRVMARQLESQTTTGIPALEEILIRDRNKACLRVLDREVKAGKKRIAIFYGAAHLPDFEERLRAMDYTRKAETWITAWELNDNDE